MEMEKVREGPSSSTSTGRRRRDSGVEARSPVLEHPWGEQPCSVSSRDELLSPGGAVLTGVDPGTVPVDSLALPHGPCGPAFEGHSWDRRAVDAGERHARGHSVGDHMRTRRVGYYPEPLAGDIGTQVGTLGLEEFLGRLYSGEDLPKIDGQACEER